MNAKLTNTIVEKLTAEQGRRLKVWDTVIAGLCLRVGSKAKTYFVVYRWGRMQRYYKLGTASALTVAQARNMAKEILGRVAGGEDPAVKTMIRRHGPIVLGKLLNDYYSPWVKGNRKSGLLTDRLIRSAFCDFMDVLTDDITVEAIERWRQKQRLRGNKSATVNRKITALKAMLNWGVKRGIIERNAMRGLETLPEHDSAVKVRYLTADESQRLFAALTARDSTLKEQRESGNQTRSKSKQLPGIKDCPYADHLLPAVIISLNTGLRKGELFSLQWNDIDLEHRVLEVRAATSKNGRSRFVPLNDKAYECLVKWRSQRSASGFVFPGKNGLRLHDCDRAFETVLRAAEIKNFRWHDMRHTFASNLVMAGVDLNTVRELLGHADLKMTLRYAHLAPKMKADAVNRI